PSSKSQQTSIRIADEAWIKHDIIIIEIEPPYRELHLLDEENKSLFEEMKKWVAEHPNEGLTECVEEFGIKPLGDALAKVLYNYKFPDFIITYDSKDKHQETNEKKRRNFERLLLRSGLVIEHERDAASDNVYVKLFAPFEKLCEQAHVIKLRMRLDTKSMKEFDELEKIVSQIDPHVVKIMRYFTHPINLKKQSAIFKVEKLRQFEGAEESKSLSDILLNFFSMSRRSLMVYRIIITANQIQKTVLSEGHEILAKCQIKSLAIQNLTKKRVYLNYFPLHDGPYKHEEKIKTKSLVEKTIYGEPRYKNVNDETVNRDVSDETVNRDVNDEKHGLRLNKRAWLYDNWVTSINRQPLEEIKEYFGEKLTLYFSWLGFYTTWLTIASIAGIIVIIYGVLDGMK
ncbi:1573_t:CDS:2, partial [Scutellospora calospora]